MVFDSEVVKIDTIRLCNNFVMNLSRRCNYFIVYYNYKSTTNL